MPHLRGRGPHFPVLDQIVQYESEPGYVVFMMPSSKRIRCKLGDILIADTIKAMVMLESDHLPIYYFPIKDVRKEFLIRSGKEVECPYKGVALHYLLNTKEKLVDNAGWSY